MHLYDSIGHGYHRYRQPDPRIAARIGSALGSAQSVVNVGAGSGSYEPRDRAVVAVDPSQTMLRQRSHDAASAVCATATALPFTDARFDAALAVLTLHHWPDVAGGLAELRRVARHTVVVLTYDTTAAGFWLTDYFPKMLEVDRRNMPALSEVEACLGPTQVVPVPVPHDCVDGFLGAYWRRPHAYLDAQVRAAISLFSQIEAVDAGLQRLQSDLDSGLWERQNAALLQQTELDIGYRLVVANVAARRSAVSS